MDYARPMPSDFAQLHDVGVEVEIYLRWNPHEWLLAELSQGDRPQF